MWGAVLAVRFSAAIGSEGAYGFGSALVSLELPKQVSVRQRW